jgi:tRNA/rRNA methyltransferase
MSSLDHISILLVEPQSAGNIGSVARAMKNLGLRHLVLINPQTELTPETFHRACGADDILQNARVTVSLLEAVQPFVLAVGSSSRAIPWIPSPLAPKELALKLMQRSADQRIALVFGPERTGLTNQHLQHCQWLVTIPTAPDFESMNLAHAVAIVAYEIYCHQHQSPVARRSEQTAELEQVEAFFERLEQCLAEIGFLNEQNPQQVMVTLRQILGRALLDPRDVSILRGILRQWSWYCSKIKKPG